MKRIATTLAATAFAAGMAGPAHALGMNEGWENITISQEQCVNAAADAIRRVEFAMQRNATTAIGFRGSRDGISIRCVAQRQLVAIVIFLGEGTPAEATTLYNRVRDAFTSAATTANRPPGAPPAAPGNTVRPGVPAPPRP